MSSLKTSSGRLREACVLRIHELRAAYDAEGKPLEPAMTYQEIVAALSAEGTVVSPGTIYNVLTGRTHKDDVPLGHPKHPDSRVTATGTP